MSNVSDKSFIYRSYPKLAYGSIHVLSYIELVFRAIELTIIFTF